MTFDRFKTITWYFTSTGRRNTERPRRNWKEDSEPRAGIKVLKP